MFLNYHHQEQQQQQLDKLPRSLPYTQRRSLSPGADQLLQDITTNLATGSDVIGGHDDDDTMLCRRVVTKDRRYITQITCYEKGSNAASRDEAEDDRTAFRLPIFGKQHQGGTLASLFQINNRRQIGTKVEDRALSLSLSLWYT